MTSVSILMPAWRFPSLDKFNGFIRENFQDSEDAIEYYQISPISRDQLTSSKNVVIKFKASDFTYKNVEGLITENKQLQIQLERTKETIQNLAAEYHKVFANTNLIKDIDHQKTLKKAKKAKKLDEDNRKLRHLLKSQLENSERVRLETQGTIEALKEEFSLLVRELANIQKKNGEWKGPEEPVISEGQGKSTGLFAENKHNNLIPKIDKLEFLLGEQQNTKVHVDSEPPQKR